MPLIITNRLQKQIVSVDGSSDGETIGKFIQKLPIMDSKFIRKTLTECEPRLDLDRVIIASSGEEVNVKITFGVEFFGLSSEYRQLIDEFYHLSKNFSFTYDNLLVMPTFERKYFINKFITEIEKKNEEMSKRKK